MTVFVDTSAFYALLDRAVAQAEQMFFQNRIFAVPERQHKTEPLLVIRNTGQAIFTPAVGS